MIRRGTRPSAGNNLVWVPYEGWIIRETDKAIGIHTDRYSQKPLWVPKSILGLVRYVDQEITYTELRAIKFDHEFTALQVEQWWAKQQRLI